MCGYKKTSEQHFCHSDVFPVAPPASLTIHLLPYQRKPNDFRGVGPSSAARTHGLLVPNLSGKLFLLVYSGFQPFSICFTYSLALLSPLFPGVPAPSVVIYVVKNASRPVSGEDSPVPDEKRFLFSLLQTARPRQSCSNAQGRMGLGSLFAYTPSSTSASQ